MIEIHAAPLQGVTDHVWRNAHNMVFGNIVCYHVPFMRVERGELRRRDVNDVLPDNNSAPIIPQILACKPQDMGMMICTLKDLGYRRVEINLGCPHVPIMKKRKGCGLLAHPEELKDAFSQIAKIDEVRYTVKMRLGADSEWQWRDALPALDILNPLYITIHPRIGKQQYQGELHIDALEEFLTASQHPVIYNGDITSAADIDKIAEKYPTLAGVMIGRGLAADPGLLSKSSCSAEAYRRFHDLILDGTMARFSGGDHQVLQHMMALWEMFLPDAPHKLRKRIAKSRNMSQYTSACNELFSELNC